MSLPSGTNESRVAILVDCDNTSPDVLEHALTVMAQFGRVVLRRGYGNSATLSNRWQTALVRLAFTPCLQFQYAAGKNTADIALALDALEAMFDSRAETFCIVTSDSDFAYLCRKLRERGATVHIVGESKTPAALRNASDQFFEWLPPAPEQEKPAAGTRPETACPMTGSGASPPPAVSAGTAIAQPPAGTASADTPKPVVKRRPRSVTNAVTLLAASSADGQVGLGALGQYLKRTDPAFTPKTYGHSTLSEMVRSYTDDLVLKLENGAYWVSLKARKDSATETA